MGQPMLAVRVRQACRADASSLPSGRFEPAAAQPWRPPAVCWRGGICRATGPVMDDFFAAQPVASATLARSDIERLIGKVPRTLIDCDLEEADISGLDLTHWRFERCNLRRSDLRGQSLKVRSGKAAGDRSPIARVPTSVKPSSSAATGTIARCAGPP